MGRDFLLLLSFFFVMHLCCNAPFERMFENPLNCVTKASCTIAIQDMLCFEYTGFWIFCCCCFCQLKSFMQKTILIIQSLRAQTSFNISSFQGLRNDKTLPVKKRGLNIQVGFAQFGNSFFLCLVVIYGPVSFFSALLLLYLKTMFQKESRSSIAFLICFRLLTPNIRDV